MKGTMKEWYSAKELAGLPGMPGTVQGIKWKAQKEQWRFQDVPAPGGPGGKRREYHISSLPEEMRIHLISVQTVQAAPPCGDRQAGTAIEAAQPRLHGLNGLNRASGAIAVPDKARAIALARLDLLRVWQEYRSIHHKAGDLDREFEHAYNAGILFPALFKVLGTVSVQTLYRWKAVLGESQDWSLLVPGYYYNSSNKPRLSRDEEKLFLDIILQPTRVKTGDAIRLFRYALQNKGIAFQKSDMTLRRFADDYKARHYDTWVLMREGQKALRDKVNIYIKRDPSLLSVGEVLVADGHRLNFQVRNPYTGKPCRATLVGYVDWKSYDLVGYEIMVEENTQCIASALRNATLNLGKYPTIAYQDNGKAFRSRFFTDTVNLEEAGIYGLFGRLGIVPVFAQPYNARAKIIERWFKGFSDTFERLIPSFCGSSIEDKPARLKRNEPFHKSIASGYVPTISQTIQLIAAWHDFHRSLPCPHVKGKTIGEVFDEGRGHGINQAELDDLMMAAKKSRIDRNGIRFLNADYYDETLYGLREEVIIRYSLFDLTQIKVCSLSGDPLCIARRVEPVHPMAAHLGDVKDVDELKQRIAEKNRNERKTIEGAKNLIALGGRVEMDWQKVIEAAPTIVKRIERAALELPPTEEHIPIEAVKCETLNVKRKTDEAIGGEETLQAGPDTNIRDFQEAAVEHAVRNRPFFKENYQRYDWHLKYGIHTDEDEAWVVWFKTTGEYKMLYEFFAKQNQEIQKAP